MAAIPVLGQLRCGKSVRILMNALAFYDQVMVMQDQGSNRGVYSGEKLPDPYSYYNQTDSTAVRRRNRGMGGLVPQQPQGFFGLDSPMPVTRRENTIPAERALTHAALVDIGELAVPIILTYAETRARTPSLRSEILQIVEEIRGKEVAAVDSSATH